MRRSTEELCHVNLASGFRGGERQTQLLIEALRPSVPRQRLVARAGAPLVERFADVSGVAVTAVRGRLSAVAATAAAGLVHAHETHGAQVALVRKQLSRTPILVTRRVVGVPSSSLFTRAIYRRADRVVAVSGAIAAVLERFDPGLCVVRIPDACGGLPASADRVGALRAAHSGKFLVGQIAAYEFAHKGQDVLLDAASRLRAEHPDVEVVFVGAGRDEGPLRARAAALTNVAVEGWTDHVGDYLGAFDLFVLPSIHEGLGSILLDAMEFGLPIVASDVDGIPDVVEDGVNGLLVPPGDADALAAAIGTLRDDPALRRAIAARNRAKAAVLDAAHMAARYLRVYSELNPRILADDGG